MCLQVSSYVETDLGHSSVIGVMMTNRRAYDHANWIKQSYFNMSSTEVYTTCQRSATLQRRHSTYQDVDGNDEHSQVMDLDRILNTRIDGLEIAFERTKAWSNYSKDLLSYIRARLQLEQEHARKVTTLVEQHVRRAAYFFSIGYRYLCPNLIVLQPFMPLRDVFESSFDSDIDLVGRTKETTDHLKARVVE
ncbi:hypothetical protein OSTOST_25620, partial [Ostertagia ostertagi]